jgi:hypothetical protein
LLKGLPVKQRKPGGSLPQCENTAYQHLNINTESTTPGYQNNNITK